uniref:Apoptosis regulator Bcl-2-like protein n=1 Tax=Acartia pacifica TaxID=335913 RepID=A0A0U2TK21_ACAPC|nr:apoptosis regulator Bcl-2-like protein [Acartia pacifica]
MPSVSCNERDCHTRDGGRAQASSQHFLTRSAGVEADNQARTPSNGESSDSYLHRVRNYLNFGSNSLRCSQDATIKEDTRRLARFAVLFSISKERILSSKTEDCLARAILRMHAKHSMVFGGMMHKLNINRDIDFYRGFVEVSEELFSDDISWSKVVALYAFAARLAQFCCENKMEDLLSNLTESLTTFSLEYLSPFIRSQGGWDKLCEAFPAEDEVEAQVWKCLSLLAVGLATCSVILALRKYG